MKVLIADDTRSARRLLCRTLEKWGYDVVATENGVDALSALADPDIHLAILDWMMPQMDGVEVCEQLQNLDQFVYAILLTSNSAHGSLAHALERGAADYVLKPFDAAELRARVRVGERIARLQHQLQNLQKLWSVGRMSATIAHYINSHTTAARARVHLIRDGLEVCTQMMEQYKTLRDQVESGRVSAQFLAKLKADLEESDAETYLEALPAALEESMSGLDRVCAIMADTASHFGPGEDDKLPTNLNAAVERVIQVTPIPQRDVCIDADLAPDLPEVPMVAAGFSVMLSGLITNAAEAIAERGGGGRIGIQTRRNAGWAEISVEDDGVGIPAEAQSRIFEPFFTTKGPDRLGQGLAQSHVFAVEEHQGAISFVRRDGGGTIFTVRLPIQ